MQWHINENRTYFPVAVTSAEGIKEEVGARGY
jgi:hypothetical protein